MRRPLRPNRRARSKGICREARNERLHQSSSIRRPARWREPCWSPARFPPCSRLHGGQDIALLADLDIARAEISETAAGHGDDIFERHGSGIGLGPRHEQFGLEQAVGFEARCEIGRAPCRERMGRYVEISVGAVYLKKKK